MGTKNNSYRIKLEELELKNGEPAEKSISFTFENHDNIFNIIDAIQQKKLFTEDDESIEFAVGLKLFSEVLIKNPSNPLFTDLLPEFKAFMKNLKNKN